MPSLAAMYSNAMLILNSSSSADVVKVMQGTNQMFESARIMRATIQIDSQLMTHPLESGSEIADFAVDKPVQVQMAVMIPSTDYESSYRSIRQHFREKSQFTIQTRADLYKNLVIASMPHEESPEVGDCISMVITYREVEWYTPSTESLPRKEVASKPIEVGGEQGTVDVKKNADTVNAGTKQPKSTLVKGFDGFSDWYNGAKS